MFGEEYRDSGLNPRKYRCRVCDKSLESFELVCDECQKRDDEFIEWDTYLEFLESEDAAYRQRVKEGIEKKRSDYDI